MGQRGSVIQEDVWRLLRLPAPASSPQLCCTSCAASPAAALTNARQECQDGEAKVRPLLDDDADSMHPLHSGSLDDSSRMSSKGSSFQRTNSGGGHAGESADGVDARGIGLAGLRAGHFPSVPYCSQGRPGARPPAAATDAKAGSVLHLIPTIRKSLRTFQQHMACASEPTEEEMRKGVQVERIYDFFDIDSKKLRVRKMFDDVLHWRKPKDELQEPEPEGSDDGSSATSSPRDTSSCSTAETQEWKSPRDQPALRRCRTLTDMELIVQWGVLVGRLLHARVLDFTFYGDVTAVKKRICGSRSVGQKKGKYVMSGVEQRAKLVVRQAELLALTVAKEKEDCLDNEWHDEAELLKHLFSKEYIDSMVLLSNGARKTVAAQPVMVEVEAPCRIFGDIHGQLRDLLLLFFAFGFPSNKQDSPCFIFNGDFVDRGSHGLAVIGLLFALKVGFPDKVFLLRGNHEDKAMNEKYGFRDECIQHLGTNFGKQVYGSIHKAFEQLPVTALISQRVLVVHGGIGDGNWRIGDLRSIRRPLGPNEFMDPANQWIVNLLWSDPIEDDDDRMRGVFGVHPSPRGHNASEFAWDVTGPFCARNGLGLIVRSHQSKQGSLGFSIMHDNLLIRVFSARDYEGHGNDGAVLLIEKKLFPKGVLLTARPQVLRSLTKSQDEALLRNAEDKHDYDVRMARQRARHRRNSLRKGLDNGPPPDDRRRGRRRSQEEREMAALAAAAAAAAAEAADL